MKRWLMICATDGDIYKRWVDTEEEAFAILKRQFYQDFVNTSEIFDDEKEAILGENFQTKYEDGNFTDEELAELPDELFGDIYHLGKKESMIRWGGGWVPYWVTTAIIDIEDQ